MYTFELIYSLPLVLRKKASYQYNTNFLTWKYYCTEKQYKALLGFPSSGYSPCKKIQPFRPTSSIVRQDSASEKKHGKHDTSERNVSMEWMTISECSLCLKCLHDILIITHNSIAITHRMQSQDVSSCHLRHFCRFSCDHMTSQIRSLRNDLRP